MNFGRKPPGTKKPQVRRETVRVLVPGQRPATALVSASAARPIPARPGPNRFQLTPAGTTKIAPVQRVEKKTVERRAVALSRGTKRKTTPQPNVFSDEEDESSEVGTSDSDGPRKRIKSSVSSVDTNDGPRRDVVLEEVFVAGNETTHYVQSTKLTSGKDKLYENPWGENDFKTIALQYPSRSKKERFELKLVKNGTADEYRPMDDIWSTIQTIAKYYFPHDLADKWLDEVDGAERRFNRAFHRESIPEWCDIVKEFNGVLKTLVEDGSIQRELRDKSGLALDLVNRILDQVFVRTVSPRTNMLNRYKTGSDNVYGELLPRMVNDIISKTHLDHRKVFIDLGSGVGNVVLQAALQTGCESWGIEMMPNPCSLARLQLKEFNSRTRLWGLRTGAVTLLDGDMTAPPRVTRVTEVLRRADVVLVNNQAFGPVLNNTLLAMFLDLKPGAQVVSLKPFVPDGHKMALRNIDSAVNMFVQRRYEYFSECVSWSWNGNGHWYIATKDAEPLTRFRKVHGLDR